MLADRLLDLRQRAGLSRLELDVLAGLTRGHCWLLEKGHQLSKPRVGISLATVQRVAAALGCSLDYLANGEGEPPSDQEIAAAVEVARARIAEQKAAG